MFILPVRFPFLSDGIVREDSMVKRIALYFLTGSFMAFVCAAVSNAQTGSDSCTREDLTKITDKYFESIQEHKTSDLSLASTAKFTENGVKKDVGKGKLTNRQESIYKNDVSEHFGQRTGSKRSTSD